MTSLIQELRRRNIFRVAAAYLVVGWLLMQVVALIEEPLGLPDWTDTLVIVLLGIGLPVALLLAWAFELTPEGVKPTEAVDPEESISDRTGRRLDWAILASLAVVVLLIIGDRVLPDGAEETPRLAEAEISEDGSEPAPPESGEVADPPPAAPDRSIAVLPFENRSAEPDDAFFAAGLHDDLLTQLSRISGMRVISRTSVMRYADVDTPIPQIASELGVGAVLEGGVQRAGDRVRINVQLIDGSNDAHLWAETYDAEMSVQNLFEIQTEITRAIAGALETVLTGEDEARLADLPTESTEAYNAYLLGNTLNVYGSLSTAQLAEAAAAYRRAVEADPGFAAAWARMADAYSTLYWWNPGDADYRRQTEEALVRSEALAPDAPETLIARAGYDYRIVTDYEPAAAAIGRALALDPNNAGAWVLAGSIYRRMGRMDDAEAAYRSAHRVDPLDADQPANIAYTLAIQGRIAEANEWIERGFALDADNLLVHLIGHYKAMFAGDREAVWNAWRAYPSGLYRPGFQTLMYVNRADRIREIETAVEELDPREAASPWVVLVTLELARWRLGRQGADEALRAAISSLETAPQVRASVRVETPPLLYALLGDEDAARDGVRRALDNRPPDRIWLLEGGADLIHALGVIGDADAALDLVEEMMDEHSPVHFARWRIAFTFDGLRDHPRYRALNARYEAWARENGVEIHD